MSGIVNGIIGAITIPLTLGVSQLGASQRLAEPASDAAMSSRVVINRLTKTDRQAGTMKSEPPLQTVSIAFPDRATSVLIRLRIVGGESVLGSRPVAQSEAADRKVGCESVVSSLAEAFERARPGRCVT